MPANWIIKNDNPPGRRYTEPSFVQIAGRPDLPR
jgi:hypothetical protein